MPIRHAKSVRRVLLQTLYQAYFEDPMNVLGPDEFLESGDLDRDALVANMHYLADRGLVELKMGYQPPLFASARITANGIDVVENEFEFELRFPGEVSSADLQAVSVPYLVERLVEEADLSPLDGEARRALLRDVQFLRDEIARPAERWRGNVMVSVLDWIADYERAAGETLPSLQALRAALDRAGALTANSLRRA
jgi:hypothetical protein